MKNLILVTIAAILTMSASVFADVKIKTKQTTSGQTTENTTYIKGKRQRTEMGSIMVSITQCDLSRDLQLNPGTKTYIINNYDNGTAATPGAVSAAGNTPTTKGGTMYVTTTIKDTGERKQMFGFTARHIIQTLEMESTPDSCSPSKTKMEMDMWVIDAEFYLPCTQTRTYSANNYGTGGGCRDKIVQKTNGTGKSGYPLWQKMTSFDANGKESFSMVQEVVELSKSTLEQSLFEIPADYREVKSAAEMYASTAQTSGVSYNGSSSSSSSSVSSGASTGMSASIRKTASTRGSDTTSIGAKTPGTIRLGLAGVKVGSVGEGVTAADLAAAIQNSLGDYLKGTKVEIVPIEAKLASAQAAEAKEKECDYIVLANATHKKGGGGGGFGFGKMLASTVAQTGIGHTGSGAGNIAGQVATTAIVTAGSMSSNVKSKDELTLDLKLQSTADNTSPLTRQFKAKAKSDGDDIISTVVEQAAQAIIDTLGK